MMPRLPAQPRAFRVAYPAALLHATLFATLFATPVAAQQRTLTASDYGRAEQFLAASASPLVARTATPPVWLDGDRFWYRVRLADGTTPMVLIDPARALRTDCGANTPACTAAVPATAAAPAGRRRGGRTPESLSPDGKKAAFIRDWNLWVRDVGVQRRDAAHHRRHQGLRLRHRQRRLGPLRSRAADLVP